MDIKILGSRGSVPVSGKRFSEYGGATSCVLVRMGGETIVFDAGTGFLNLADVLTEEEKKISLLLSHPHADHLLGLGMSPLVFSKDCTFDVYGANRDGRSVREQFDAYYKPPLWPVGPDNFAAKFTFNDIAKERTDNSRREKDSFEIGRVQVRTMEGIHPGGVTLYRLEADGEVLVYATDCTLTDSFRGEFLSFAKDADLLFIDGQYSEEEWKSRENYGHNTWNMAAQAGLDANAKKTIVVHHSVYNTDSVLRLAEEEARRINPNLSFAREEQPGLTEQEQFDLFLSTSLSLSAERDREKLLSNILDTAMEIASCDGGTLYLLEEDGLHFCRMVTKSQNIRQGGHADPITLPPVPLDPNYASAWVALNNRSVNIPDIHGDTGFNFQGSYRYDAMTGYHTQSMLMSPLTNDKGELIGVMQLINAKNASGETIPFDASVEKLIDAIASQAAISITNMKYADQITLLLDSLVGALSTAIDERTPYNANHTRNMVRYGANFLDWLEKTGHPEAFDTNKRRTFLLSVWLHDVGKLVVPLEVMDKATRLGPNLEKIETRFREKELLAKIDLLEGRITEEESAKLEAERNDALETIRAANTAGFLQDDLLAKVEDLAAKGFLTDEEHVQLTVRKGTLTAEERGTMESHVSVTKKILANVAFPKMYAQVPAWASAHHELLNGNGYPNHLKAEDIPAEVRLLTILDVFDALTARDRPYKPAMPLEKALSILHIMAEKEGSIDPEILKLFEESKAWEVNEQ